MGELIFSLTWRIKVPRKVKIFSWLVLHGRLGTLDRLSRNFPSLIGPFCCILCWKANEDLDHVLWQFEMTSYVWDAFFRRLPFHMLNIER